MTKYDLISLKTSAVTSFLDTISRNSINNLHSVLEELNLTLLFLLRHNRLFQFVLMKMQIIPMLKHLLLPPVSIYIHLIPPSTQMSSHHHCLRTCMQTSSQLLPNPDISTKMIVHSLKANYLLFLKQGIFNAAIVHVYSSHYCQG